MAYRNPQPDELGLLHELIRRAHLNNVDEKWTQAIRVQPLEDGGMRSFRVRVDADMTDKRRTGRCASELQYDDTDGVRVIASLYLDLEGLPYEVDLWKVNFQPVCRLPYK
jgi:hypothetical protein